MAQLVVGAPDEMRPGYSAPTCTVDGDAASTFFCPDDYSLWLSVAELGAGATVTWGDDHGDEGIYLLEGSVTIDGLTVGAGGVVVVEAGVAISLRADEPSRIIHAGPTDPRPPADGLLGAADPSGHGVHVIPFADSVRVGDDPAMVNFTDSTCATCRIAFFLGESDHALTAASHVHSEDEIIHILSGRLRFGRHVIEPGTSVAIPANLRYGFRSDGPFLFLNFRRDVSTMVLAPGSTPFMETVEALADIITGESGFPHPHVVLG